MTEDTHRISFVRPGSPAQAAGIRPGDSIEEIGGKKLRDIFDYYYYEENTSITLLIKHQDGSSQEYTITKSDEDTDIGLTFENGLLDNYRSCANHCMFCFIDQMPPGMRKTLYFKDDDTRLSFLQGNYVTLTNMSDDELQRVIDYRLSPINVSVHTTNPDLRVRMLANKNASRLMERIKRIAGAGLTMNTQVVLCKGINDGAELDRTIGDLLEFYPQVTSLSVVPVGLTKYRKNLCKLSHFEKSDAIKVVRQIEMWQQRAMEKTGHHFVYASDEWYLTAEIDIPKEEVYEDFAQLENGVGMIRLLLSEFEQALAKEGIHPFRKERLTIATGVLAAPFISQMADMFMKKYPRIRIEVVTIINHYFGEQITVSGLITGSDLKEQLAGMDLGERLLLPVNMLRSNEEVFLDDVTVDELSETLQVPVTVVKSGGQDLLDALLDRQ